MHVLVHSGGAVKVFTEGQEDGGGEGGEGEGGDEEPAKAQVV